MIKEERMKVNLQYYKENEDLKPIGEEYEEVLEKVEKTENQDFSKALERHAKIKNVLALSKIRENIVSWYGFKKDATILELNANYGEITGFLCEKAKRVVAIEASKKYATVIEKRHASKENLELMVGNFLNIDLQEKFDYIVIVGMVENLKDALTYAKKYGKEDSTILLAVNNKFGMKSWITTKQEAKVVSNQKTTISKEKLEELLEGMHYQYYYPLPDYKLPNVIYTNNAMPTVSNIYRDITYKDEMVNFKEVDAYREILQNNPEDFKKFANSFFLEITNKEKEKSDIRFISFSNLRKEEYQIKTIVREKQVEKTKANEAGIRHIENVKKNIETLEKLGIKTLDSYQTETIVSRYVEAPTLEDRLITIYQKEGKEAFLQKIEEYREFLKEKLKVTKDVQKNIFTKYRIKVEEEKKNQLTFVEYGLWDLIFQNCFIIDNEYYFYDQEWQEQNVPVEYILYRAIIYFHESKQYISDEEILERLKLAEWIPIFKMLDDKIQEKIRNPLLWKFHSKEELEQNRYAKTRNELKQKEEEIQNLKVELEKLKRENEQKQNEIGFMQNSLSWRVTKPLRKIRKMIG